MRILAKLLSSKQKGDTDSLLDSQLSQGGYSGFPVTGMIEGSQKSGPKKIPGLPAKPKKIPGTKVLRHQGTTNSFYYPQKIPAQIKQPKKILAKFSYPKNPGIENFKPKKILQSSPSLEIPSTSPGQLSLSSEHRVLLFLFNINNYIDEYLSVEL